MAVRSITFEEVFVPAHREGAPEDEPRKAVPDGRLTAWARPKVRRPLQDLGTQSEMSLPLRRRAAKSRKSLVFVGSAPRPA